MIKITVFDEFYGKFGTFRQNKKFLSVEFYLIVQLTDFIKINFTVGWTNDFPSKYGIWAKNKKKLILKKMESHPTMISWWLLFAISRWIGDLTNDENTAIKIKETSIATWLSNLERSGWLNYTRCYHRLFLWLQPVFKNVSSWTMTMDYIFNFFCHYFSSIKFSRYLKLNI